MKRFAFICLALIFFLPLSQVLANPEINEIMYDLKTGSDDGREWIEVFNNSNTEVDLSTLRFFEGNTNHKLTLVQGNTRIEPAGYALIVADPIKFKPDWPSFNGTIFDSTFSLSNTGETIMIKSEEEIMDQIAYTNSQGGAGDGNSLQKIKGVWQAALPTLGVENRPSVKPMIVQNKALNTTLASSPTPITKPLNSSIQPIEKSFPQEKEDESSWLLFVTTLIGLIIIGSIATYFIRGKKSLNKRKNNGEDFEIIE